MNQPTLTIGIMNEPVIRFALNGRFRMESTGEEFSGQQRISYDGRRILLNGTPMESSEIIFHPVRYHESSFDLSGVTIGKKFHWERKEEQRFKGSLKFITENGQLTAINILPLEDYLISVISSEMSATSSLELLKAHAVISRSWLLAQVVKGEELKKKKDDYRPIVETDEEYIRWYDREDHLNFDVCADDHCQRYQGITRQSSELVTKAIEETFGLVLMHEGQICDARFSKSCGGITETFENTWEPVAHPYLQSIVDDTVMPEGLKPDLTDETAAERWIRNAPPAFCNTTDRKVLSQVLNDYDRETPDFYRWTVGYSQEELSELIARKSGRDFGKIIDLVPVQRGKSGRVIKLKIIGTKKTLIIGKELEIRKTLSETHLYSSAFVVDRQELVDGIPGKFILTGAGWGHGVGLCQIGAAMMGEKGYRFDEILGHYFREAKLNVLYKK